VVQIGCSTIPTPSRAFFGGLQDWIGSAAPTAEAISGRAIVAWGERSLELDGIAPPAQFDAMGGPQTMFLNGAEPVRPARREEWGKLPVLGFLGYDFIKSLAEQRLVLRGGAA
jgi:hypothetical protein